MYYKLNKKHQEIDSHLMFPRMYDTDEWLRETPNETKLLALLCASIDVEIANHFTLDDILFEALENEYDYNGFKFTRDEVVLLIESLNNRGYLDIC